MSLTLSLDGVVVSVVVVSMSWIGMDFTIGAISPSPVIGLMEE